MGKIAGSNPTEGRFLSRIEIFSWILFEILFEIKKPWMRSKPLKLYNLRT